MCSAIKPPHLNEMKKLVKQAELRLKASMVRPMGLPRSSGTIRAHPSKAKKKKGANKVERLFNIGSREELNPSRALGGRRLYLCSDGWFDAQKRPIINFMSGTESGLLFLSPVSVEGFTKSKFYIVDRVMENVREVEHQNVIQIITKNAQVRQAAGSIAKGHYAHIFWTFVWSTL